MYNIYMGVPEMEKFWNDLVDKNKNNTLSSDEKKIFKKLVKTIKLLEINPSYNSLQTHEIEELTERYGMKVWQSYMENRTPRASRIYWVYGPNKNDITIIGLEPHPDDKSNAYKKIRLSSLND